MRPQDTDFEPSWGTLAHNTPISRFLRLSSSRLKVWRGPSHALRFALAFFRNIRQRKPIRRHLAEIATVIGAERISGEH